VVTRVDESWEFALQVISQRAQNVERFHNLCTKLWILKGYRNRFSRPLTATGAP